MHEHFLKRKSFETKYHVKQFEHYILDTGNTVECVNIQATAAGTGSSDSPACTVTAKAICEVNLVS